LEYGVRINLKNEVVVGDRAQSAHGERPSTYRLKPAVQLRVPGGRGVRFDCTAVQQVDNMPVTLLAARHSSWKWRSSTGRAGGGHFAALLVATYRLLVLMTEGTIVCTRQGEEVLRAYDVAMGKVTGHR
jgi:hypothetical protein